MSTILFRSCWVPFRSPPFSACRRSFNPPNWPNLSFYSDLVGSRFELRAAHPYWFWPGHPTNEGSIGLCFHWYDMRQNGHQFTDDIFKSILLFGDCFILIQIALKFAHKGPIYTCCLMVPSHYLNQNSIVVKYTLFKQDIFLPYEISFTKFKHSRKCYRKCCLQNSSRFVQASMCL